MCKTNNLRELAKAATLNCHAPYSNALIGSALTTESGKVFSGCNIENSSFGGTVCAERVAVWKAISEGEKKIKEIYVYSKDGWPPCGLCTQVLAEFCDDDLQIIVGNESGEEKRMSFKEYFPYGFTPKIYNQGK
jgi:cytidine deaminase